jgi:hypothetical protein
VSAAWNFATARAASPCAASAFPMLWLENNM